MGIISSEFERPDIFLEQLIEPIKTFGLKHENPLIRYFSVEYVVNLILIMRENIFRAMWSFFNVLLDVRAAHQSLRDINEKVRYAALSLNEILKDMIIEYVNSTKLNLTELVRHFSNLLPQLNVSSYRDLVLQWILLFEGLPTFNLSDHFT